MGPSVGYYNYWGKWGDGNGSAHQLAYHCLDVAACFHSHLVVNPGFAEELHGTLGGLGCLEDAIAWMTWLASIHDLGKFGSDFQAKVPEAVEAVGGVSVAPRFDMTWVDCGAGPSLIASKK